MSEAGAREAAPATGDSWHALVPGPLPVDAVSAWVVRPDCGGIVVFSGTAHDHSDGRAGVTLLEYEAYDEQVVPRFAAIEHDAREQWPTLGRVAMLHRTGVVPIAESAVVVAVSAPHRDEAFAAARHCIDTLKAAAPIWKRESWSGEEGGSAWGLDAQPIAEPGTREGARP